MNAILATPLPLRLILLAMIGTLAGGWINWATYRLAWNRRTIGPWSPAHPEAPRRRLSDYVPVVGWLGLRREAALHGRSFWIRPLAVEIFTGLLLPALYLWETQFDARLWAMPGMQPPPAAFLTDQLVLVAHWRFVSHAILLCLMLAASLIDLDEKMIPDAITIVGTLVALVLAAVYPWSLLPAVHFAINGQVWVEFLTLASPNFFPAALAGWPAGTGLAVALGCWTLWCGGLLPRFWKRRRGVGIAARIFFRRLFGEQLTYWIIAIWLLGLGAIAGAARGLDVAAWAGLLTALVGMAAGGGVIWLVRQIGAAVLHKEAMGFGDVTLMAMIGAFLGWQVCLMIFFVAPFFGLVLALIGWILHREHEIPYGPFLCLGAVTVVVRWPDFWAQTEPIFALGWLVPALIAVCFVLLAVLLWMYTLLLKLVTGRRP